MSDGDSARPRLTSAQAARYIGCELNTLYYWQSKGIGPPKHKVGRYSKYSRDDLDAFLASLRQEEA